MAETRESETMLTSEQANSLVNAAIDDHSIGKLGVVVMDELHMLADEGRGYILELMATKLLSLEQNIQLIGMSATLNVGLTEMGMPAYLLTSNRMRRC
jgi:replicative superfamily II helicase